MKEKENTMSKTVPLEAALEYAAQCASSDGDAPHGINKVCIERDVVTSTNGHILLQLPIKSQSWLEGKRLVPAEQALVLAKQNGEGQAELQGIAQSDGKYPNIKSTIASIQKDEPVIEVCVSSAYLETIARAFGELGATNIRIIIRGKYQAIEMVPGRLHAPQINAFLMPMR